MRRLEEQDAKLTELEVPVVHRVYLIHNSESTNMLGDLLSTIADACRAIRFLNACKEVSESELPLAVHAFDARSCLHTSHHLQKVLSVWAATRGYERHAVTARAQLARAADPVLPTPATASSLLKPLSELSI